MSKVGAIYCKKILSLVVITICGFIYLEQKMCLLKLGYQKANLEQAIKKQQERMEQMRYQIASLENPYRLEKEFFECNPKFTPASSVRVVKIPYREYKLQKQSPVSEDRKVLFAEEIP
ncbi:MAG TPA: hypothetical protein ENF97_00635 [Candidatus Omnitrophica bacterium]|nr:hypothetical protein [Candidatus Omnitrophota bacterium]